MDGIPSNGGMPNCSQTMGNMTVIEVTRWVTEALQKWDSSEVVIKQATDAISRNSVDGNKLLQLLSAGEEDLGAALALPRVGCPPALEEGIFGHDQYDDVLIKHAKNLCDMLSTRVLIRAARSGIEEATQFSAHSAGLLQACVRERLKMMGEQGWVSGTVTHAICTVLGYIRMDLQHMGMLLPDETVHLIPLYMRRTRGECSIIVRALSHFWMDMMNGALQGYTNIQPVEQEQVNRYNKCKHLLLVCVHLCGGLLEDPTRTGQQF
jgi:hypothetical protein